MMSIVNKFRNTTLSLLLIASVLFDAQGQSDYDWKLYRPSNTGIPGEEIMQLEWAPGGKLWASARWPFWGEAGIGVLDTETEIWTGWNNWQDPLPSQFINDIKFDTNGIAWIATDNGLVKFDGETWEIFNATNTPMQVQEVQNISIAPNGTIWITNSSGSSYDNAIWAFDGVSEWEDYRIPDDLPWGPGFNEIECVYAASDGSIYATATYWNGVAKFDGNNWTLHGDNFDRFDQITEDGDGNIWMVTGIYSTFNRVYKFDGTDITFYSFSDPTVTAFDSETGYLYVGFWTGEIQRTNDGGLTWETWATGLGPVRNIDPKPGSNEIWVSNIATVYRMDASGEILQRLNSYNTGMADYFVDYAITKTKDGNIWLASGQAGLNRFDGVKWRNWGVYNLESEEYPFGGNTPVYNVYQDDDGDVWMASNGIARWIPETNEFTGFWNWQNSTLSLWMRYIIEDGYGNLFSFGEEGGIYNFENDDWLENTTTVANGIYGVEKDSQGNLWAAGKFDLHFWDGNSWETIFANPSQEFLQYGGINCMDIDADDVLWFGTPSGLLRWDGENFTLYDENNSPLPANNIKGIDIREDGLMGISAADNNPQSGIALLDGDPDLEDNWIIFPYAQTPQPHWQVEDVAFDANGDLWMSALSMGAAVLGTGNADLEIDATNPEEQATDVDPSEAITVTFNQDIAAYNLSGITITPDPGEVLASTEGNTLVIEHNPFDHQTTYTVHIPAFSVTNGWLPFEDDILWSFTTALPTSNREINNEQLNVYPNPAITKINITLQNASPAAYRITDLTGRLHSSGTISKTDNTIDVDKLPGGIYILYVQSKKMTHTTKLVLN